MCCEKRRNEAAENMHFYMPAMPPLKLINFLECRFIRWNKNRRIKKLLKLDDHLLRDLGHSRAELQQMLEE